MELELLLHAGFTRTFGQSFDSYCVAHLVITFKKGEGMNKVMVGIANGCEETGIIWQPTFIPG